MHDFIDTMTIRQLPATRTILGENRQAAVEVVVMPSQRAPGQIVLRSMDLPALNVFDVPEAPDLIAAAHRDRGVSRRWRNDLKDRCV